MMMFTIKHPESFPFVYGITTYNLSAGPTLIWNNAYFYWEETDATWDEAV